MTAAAVSAGIVPPHPAWRSLLWIAPPTLLWTLLIYWQPTISDSGAPTAAARLMTYGLIGLGLWLGLESTDLTPGQRCTTWLAVMPAEIRQTVQPYLNGTIREWYSRADGRGVVLLLDTRDVAEAQAIMEGLPLAKQNLMDHEYIAVGPLLPLRLLMAHP